MERPTGHSRQHPLGHSRAMPSTLGRLTHILATSMLPAPVVPEATKQGVRLAAVGPEECSLGNDTVLVVSPNEPRACSER